MGRNMRTRIFWPVLAVILFLTAGVWISFAATSEQYAAYTAEKYTAEMIGTVEEGKENIYREAQSLQNKENARQYSKELLQYVKSHIKTGETAGKLFVFNSKLRQTYPQTPEEGTVPDRLRQACTELLEKNAEITSLEKTLNIDGEYWHIRISALDTEYNVRAKYFVAAAQLPNLSLMWSYMGKLLAGITTAAIVLGAVLVWLAAGSITRPLRRFCQQVQSAGMGKTGQISEAYSLSELETLKKAYNQMEARIRQSQASKDRFFQNVSHDLRTPLASIVGYAQGIQRGVMKSPQEAAGIILSESLRMKNLVDSIPTLTKIDNRELKLHLVQIDLEEFLEERLDALRGMAGVCRLELEIQREGMTIQTDPQLLNRIVQNVISNCIRYAKETVTVRLKAEDTWAVIYVEDDGNGFSKEDLPHVFERFYQGEKGAFGIGLSVVWSGITYLGGRVEIGNLEPPLHGAFYRLYFPLS
ncbi:MAG: HAMP domain-containing histidine kinase [Clostridiales bacterium]|nr:HAMP domain-containing histidine kinase [Clostridiales bacterium]